MNYFIAYNDKLPNYEEFYEGILRQNLVCLLNQRVTADWRCRKDWIHDDGTINFDYLQSNYGEMIVPVYNCDLRYFNSNPCKDMLLKDFVKYWREVINNDYNYEVDRLPLLYLKDWHLSYDGQDKNFYSVPEYFESDYLNEYCLSNGKLDFKFVYMGPKNSNTPLHIDVFSSYSWSANVIGRKRWLFVPPKNVEELYEYLGYTPRDLYAIDDCQKIFKRFEIFEVIQEKGEIIFVPSGFLHQVINLEDTISINHNWFNACNIKIIYSKLLDSFEEVKKELGDLIETKVCSKDEWIEKCEQITDMHFGMNRLEFIKMIVLIMNRSLDENKGTMMFKKEYEFRHKNDLRAIGSIVEEILNNEDLKSLLSIKELDSFNNFLQFVEYNLIQLNTRENKI